MGDFDRGAAIPHTGDMSTDAGLRSFMLGVYNKMMVGLLLAGGLAWIVGNVDPVTRAMFNIVGDRVTGYSPLGLVVAFAPLGIILFSNFFLRNLTPRTSGVLYWSLVSIIGASLGLYFLTYDPMAMASAFLVTATSFGGLSLFGYVTKRNLSGIGSFAIMGLWGVVIAGVLSFAVPGLAANPLFFFLFNIVGVLVTSILIAFRTQQLKMTYYEVQGDQLSLAVATNYGALNLFINFINMFQFILSLMGGRR